MDAEVIRRFEQQNVLLSEWTRTRRQIAALEARSAELLSERLAHGRGRRRDADAP
ncbi:hypothetical protein ACFWHT_14640 [Microbacterium sp. NPDC058342]|uniref:hypothetical protein n=1 Tax=Microbacterium sp. NPDC058342 TaxID=3346454 RepID=UPI00364ADCA2